MPASGWKYVTDSEIIMVNTLIDNGMSKAKVSEVTGRAGITLNRMIGCADMAEYKERYQAERDKREAKQLEKVAGEVFNGDEPLGKAPESATGKQIDDDDLVAWRKQVISQQNTIISVLKAIEYQLAKGSDGSKEENKGIRRYIGR